MANEESDGNSIRELKADLPRITYGQIAQERDRLSMYYLRTNSARERQTQHGLLTDKQCKREIDLSRITYGKIAQEREIDLSRITYGQMAEEREIDLSRITYGRIVQERDRLSMDYLRTNSAREKQTQHGLLTEKQRKREAELTWITYGQIAEEKDSFNTDYLLTNSTRESQTYGLFTDKQHKRELDLRIIYGQIAQESELLLFDANSSIFQPYPLCTIPTHLVGFLVLALMK